MGAPKGKGVWLVEKQGSSGAFWRNCIPRRVVPMKHNTYAVLGMKDQILNSKFRKKS